MRPFTAPAVLLTLVLTGCNGSAPTAPQPLTASPSLEGSGADGANSTHQAVPERPVKGQCEVETVEVTPIAPAVIRSIAVGTCQLSHLGRTELRSVLETSLVTLDQVGEQTYTAANGDLLYATSAGRGTLTPLSTIHFIGVTTVSGGTGRFANAVGVMQVAGTSDVATGRTSISYDGWIAY